MALKSIKSFNSSAWAMLHEELLVKIFVQQPVKTLVQLRRVCKSWNQIISSEYLIKTHLAHQNSCSITKNKIVLLDHRATYFPHNIIDTGSFCVSEDYIYNADNIFGIDIEFNCLQLYGICDGVLCLSEDGKYWQHSNHRIFLWNPFLKKGKKLPPLGSDFEVEHPGEPCLCFGHYADDYKLIYINPLRNVYHVYIYSLSTNSWKLSKFDIDNDTYGFSILCYPKVSLVNGIAYFTQHSRRDGRILSFDLSCEIIRYIDFPKDFDFNVDYLIKEYGQLIGLVSCGKGDLVMWVLRVSDNSFTWDKKFTVKVQDRQLLGFINNKQLVLRKLDRRVRKCFLYNVEDGFEQRFTTLDLESSTLSYSLNRIHYLTESLVLLGESTTAEKE